MLLDFVLVKSSTTSILQERSDKKQKRNTLYFASCKSGSFPIVEMSTVGVLLDIAYEPIPEEDIYCQCSEK